MDVGGYEQIPANHSQILSLEVKRHADLRVSVTPRSERTDERRYRVVIALTVGKT